MSKTKWIVTVVAVAVLAVVAAAVLVIGVTTHSETTYLEVCWTNDGVEYVEPMEGVTKIGKCPDPVPAIWKRDRIPLGVASMPFRGDDGDPRNAAMVKRAVQHVNAQVGFKLLRYVEQDDYLLSVILVRWNTPQAKGDAPAGCAHYTFDGEHVGAAQIYMRNTGGERTTWKALLHELGHGVGLGHDDYQDSVMYWEQGDDTFGRIRLDRFPDADVDWLTKQYASKN